MHTTTHRRTCFMAGRANRWGRIATVALPAPAIRAPGFTDGLPYFCEGNAQFECDNAITRGRLCSECQEDSR